MARAPWPRARSSCARASTHRSTSSATLAEATCSFLALDRQRDEALGFAADLGARLALALPYVAERGTTLITNAGGVNPVAAHQLALATARASGFLGLRIGLVFADLAPDVSGPTMLSVLEDAEMALCLHIGSSSRPLIPHPARQPPLVEDHDGQDHDHDTAGHWSGGVLVDRIGKGPQLPYPRNGRCPNVGESVTP